MTAVAVVCAIAAGAAGLANWWSRLRENRGVELWSKPATLAALIGVALALDAADPAVRAWFVVGLLFSLVGDVLLLDDRRFIGGLLAFLAGHLAYVGGFVAADPWRWWSAGVGVVIVMVLVAVVGTRIVSGARAKNPKLGIAVIAYLVVISAMAVAAAGAGDWWAVGGAAIFVASDTILGWRRFVGEQSWMSPAVMVTYHLGQAGLVASLL